MSLREAVGVAGSKHRVECDPNRIDPKRQREFIQSQGTPLEYSHQHGTCKGYRWKNQREDYEWFFEVSVFVIESVDPPVVIVFPNQKLLSLSNVSQVET